jgi:hypothetical protein
MTNDGNLTRGVTAHPTAYAVKWRILQACTRWHPHCETHGQLKHRRLQMNKGLLLAVALIVELLWIVSVLPQFLPLFL